MPILHFFQLTSKTLIFFFSRCHSSFWSNFFWTLALLLRTTAIPRTKGRSYWAVIGLNVENKFVSRSFIMSIFNDLIFFLATVNCLLQFVLFSFGYGRASWTTHDTPTCSTVDDSRPRRFRDDLAHFASGQIAYVAKSCSLGRRWTCRAWPLHVSVSFVSGPEPSPLPVDYFLFRAASHVVSFRPTLFGRPLL